MTGENDWEEYLERITEAKKWIEWTERMTAKNDLEK